MSAAFCPRGHPIAFLALKASEPCPVCAREHGFERQIRGAETRQPGRPPHPRRPPPATAPATTRAPTDEEQTRYTHQAHAPRAPKIGAGMALLTQFAADHPGLTITPRDRGAVARITGRGLLADYWPRRQFWHDVLKNRRGQGFDQLEPLLRAALPAPPIRSLDPAPTGLFRHYQRPRRSQTPPYLFVCDDCYHAFRQGLPALTTHVACAARLARRLQEYPSETPPEWHGAETILPPASVTPGGASAP